MAVKPARLFVADGAQRLLEAFVHAQDERAARLRAQQAGAIALDLEVFRLQLATVEHAQHLTLDEETEGFDAIGRKCRMRAVGAVVQAQTGIEAFGRQYGLCGLVQQGVAEGQQGVDGVARRPAVALFEGKLQRQQMRDGAKVGMRVDFDRQLALAGIRPVIRAEVDDMAMLRLLARESDALALVPPIVVRDELNAGLLVERCRIPDLTESFHAIVRTRRFPNPLVKELLARTVTATG